MNLIGDPWIPVIFEEGVTRLVSLQELYEKAEVIRDLILNPPQRISVMRLLICISQAALDGPTDEDDWLSCRELIILESLKYLEARRGKFELFGEQPFLQVKDLDPIDNATLDKLDFGLASGNNPTLFDHGADKEGRPHEPAWIALMLLTYQCFSPGGRIGVTTWARTKTGNGSSEHAPCLESSPMHSILRGEHLAHTIHLNLLTREQVKTLPGGQWGVPIWDAFPSSQQGEDVNALTHSYLGRLVPLSRAILLHPASTYCTLANGLSYPKLPAGREPMVTVVLKGKGNNQKPAYLNINLSRHAWRELGSLLNLNRMGVAGGALALDHLVALGGQTVDFWVGGLVADRGKLLDVAEWNFSLPLNLLNSAQIEKYRKGVEKANQGERCLRDAIGKYCDYLKAEAGGFKAQAVSAYWTTLDADHKKLIDIACNPCAPMEQWREFLIKTIHDTYGQACPHETSRQIQAFAVGRRALRIGRTDA